MLCLLYFVLKTFEFLNYDELPKILRGVGEWEAIESTTFDMGNEYDIVMHRIYDVRFLIMSPNINLMVTWVTVFTSSVTASNSFIKIHILPHKGVKIYYWTFAKGIHIHRWHPHPPPHTPHNGSVMRSFVNILNVPLNKQSRRRWI